MTKILIVDDSESMRNLVRFVIEDAGYEVIEATDAAQAIKLSQQHQDIKIIISDLNMPGMDGITMTKEIKLNHHYKKTPVIMLTTESSDVRKEMGKEAGILAWVTKPVSPERLVNVIKKLVSSE